MSKSEVNKLLIENYMKKEIDKKIIYEEQGSAKKIFDPALQNFYLNNVLYDYVYPFCLLFKTDEKIPDLDVHFRMNYRYLFKLR